MIAPETWAAGVTYERSRSARMHESKVVDVYELVYDAERPELFLKDAAGRRTVGPGEPIAARSDASWTVPEPELAVIVGAQGPLAVTIGNDVSSRDIEGANPLYLPQAKIYDRACALGPAVLVPESLDAHFQIECRILDSDGADLFAEETSTESMCRSIDELIEYLRRDNPVPAGSVLLTGTGLVPPDDVTLTPGYTVEIRIPEIGTAAQPGCRGQSHRRLKAMSDTITAPGAANFVAGKWTAGSAGRTYERHNPWRPSEVVGEFPSSSAEDVDAAVAAAVGAFPEWSALPAAKRGAILTRAAAAIESRVEDIAQDMTREMGKPLRESRLEAARAAQILRFFAGEGWRPVGADVRAVRDRLDRVHAAPAARRGRADHAVELPGRDPGVEDRAGAGLREHGRAQARAGLAADRAAPGARARGGGASRRRPQRGHRSWQRGRGAAGERSPRAARSRSPARCRSATACAIARPRSASECNSSSAATTR